MLAFMWRSVANGASGYWLQLMAAGAMAGVTRLSARPSIPAYSSEWLKQLCLAAIAASNIWLKAGVRNEIIWRMAQCVSSAIGVNNGYSMA